nr:ABC transporter permease [Pseudodesulfovibrio sp.]
MDKVSTISQTTKYTICQLWVHRNALWRSSLIELKKRYAGSAIGYLWVVLYPILFLSIYVFVYQVVFKVKVTGVDTGGFHYVLFVFSGLVPYIALMEAFSTGCLSIKQNMHLIKNVLAPIETVPVRPVIISMITQLVGMALVLVLSAVNGSLSPMIALLPLVMIFQFMMFVGIVWVLSALAIALPDIGYFVNLGTFLLMFVSPIAFTKEMVPASLAATLYFNPVYYMVEMYRSLLWVGSFPPLFETVVFVVMSSLTFLAGAIFFGVFKYAILDHG